MVETSIRASKHESDQGTPSVDDVALSSLHEKERIEVTTADDWTLVITRYKPVPQDFPQPIFGQPILLVHGFAQNRRAWTAGDFVKSMLFFGADLFILEQRGHGQSSRGLQRRRSRMAGKNPPEDIDWGWDIDSYFLFDLPAAIGKVRQVSGKERVFYCGHSMGGMLGYGYAGLHPDQIAGLVTIGSPSDFVGMGFLVLGLIARLRPALPAVDLGLWATNALRDSLWRCRKLVGASDGSDKPLPWRFDFVPTDNLLRLAEGVLNSERYASLTRILPNLAFLVNPERTLAEDVRWLLREGSDREPRGVVEQFSRWIRNNEVVCYRTGYDYKRGFAKIACPTAIIFGDRDWLAGVRATRSIYYGAKSEYLLWRPVKGNSHVELTMGHDIRQVCYDVKNLVEYATASRSSKPSLPRRGL
ncbi:MAG: alpha/beta hydrolase [Myxococcota bacterium]